MLTEPRLRDYYTRFALELSPRTWNILTYWLAFQSLEMVVAALAFTLDRQKPRWSLLPYLILQRFCYRQLIYWVAMKATAAAIRGGIMGWGKLQRRGLGNSNSIGIKLAKVGAEKS